MKRGQRCHLGRMLALRHRDQWERLNIPTQGSQEGWEASVSLKCFSRQGHPLWNPTVLHIGVKSRHKEMHPLYSSLRISGFFTYPVLIRQIFFLIFRSCLLIFSSIVTLTRVHELLLSPETRRKQDFPQ